MDNEQRAEKAFRTVLAHYGNPMDGESVIYDLLCDLHHLADQYGYEWADLTRMGEWHYGEEIAEEVEEPQEKRVLTCDMVEGCAESVAMIDQKGYAYCEPHGMERRGWMPCRKLRGWELRRLESGKPLTRY